MASEEMVRRVTLVAKADLSNDMYRFLAATRLDDGTLGVVRAGAGNVANGVLYSKPVVGEAASVAVSGKVKVIAGGAFQAGVRVAVDAQGRAVAATGNVAGVGLACEDASTAGQVVQVEIDLLG